MTDEQILEELVRKDIKLIVAADDDLKELYESGRCEIKINNIYIGPGEFSRPIEGVPILKEAIEREREEKPYLFRTIKLEEGEALIDAYFIWGPRAARGLTYTLKKYDDKWEIKSREHTWMS